MPSAILKKPLWVRACVCKGSFTNFPNAPQLSHRDLVLLGKLLKGSCPNTCRGNMKPQAEMVHRAQMYGRSKDPGANASHEERHCHAPCTVIHEWLAQTLLGKWTAGLLPHWVNPTPRQSFQGTTGTRRDLPCQAQSCHFSMFCFLRSHRLTGRWNVR